MANFMLHFITKINADFETNQKPNSTPKSEKFNGQNGDIKAKSQKTADCRQTPDGQIQKKKTPTGQDPSQVQ